MPTFGRGRLLGRGLVAIGDVVDLLLICLRGRGFVRGIADDLKLDVSFEFLAEMNK